jgi:hypothetical protein
MLMQARAQQDYLGFITSSDTARERMADVFAETDTRLPTVERGPAGREVRTVRQPGSTRVIRAAVCRGVAGGDLPRAVPLG